MADGIQVGDAVLNFVANTTGVEQGFKDVNQAAVTQLGPTRAAIQGMETDIEVTSTGAREMGEVMNLAGEEAKFSMYEAKGEIGLLGEEIGVKLPRHVRSFVAELPGVGEAMTAAFSATAVLFIIQALIEATEKAVEFATELAYNTEGQKENEQSVKNLNGELAALRKMYEDAKAQADAYGKSALQLAQDARDKVQKSVVDLTKELKDQEEEIKKLSEETQRHLVIQLSVSEAYTQWRAGLLTIGQALKAVTVGVDESMEAQKKLAEAQNAHIKTAAELALAQQNLIIVNHGVSKAAADSSKVYFKALQELIDALDKLDKENEKFNETARKGTQVFEAQVEIMPAVVRQILDTANAYRTLGLTSTGSYQMQATAAQKAYAEIYAASQKGLATDRDVLQARLKLIAAEIALAKARGQSTKALEKEMQEQKKMLGETAEFGKLAKQVADQVGHAILQTAFAYGQGAITISQALRQVTGTIVQEIAKQAEVQGAANLAKAFGDLGDHDYGAAGHHFAAAGAWFALAGGISAGAGAISGSSAKPGSAANPVNVTGTGGQATGGSPVPLGGTALQSFASGGLITKSTIAQLGDRPGSKGEVAFDLADERAKSHIRDAMGTGGGGGTTVIIHGLLSADNLKKTFKKAGIMVKKGQMQVLASNSHRVTKRSV